jgi:cyclase
MTKRRTALAALVALAALPAAPAARAQDFSGVEIRTHKLGPSVYMLQGAGGNIGLSVGDDAVFVIDDQFAPLVPKIRAAIGALTPKPVRFLLNTHFHSDHSGGNEGMAREGALIVAHDNTRRRMSSAQLLAFVGARQEAAPPAALPLVTVAGDVRFHINGDEIHAFHVPRAHTDGDLVVHFVKSDIVHMGDTFFNGNYPFIDVSSGGSADGLVAAADRVLALAGDRTRIIPGHGPVATRADLQAWRDMVAAVAQRIQEQRAGGKSDDQIAAAKPAADFDARYGNGFIKPELFVRMMLAATAR